MFDSLNYLGLELTSLAQSYTTQNQNFTRSSGEEPMPVVSRVSMNSRLS